MDEGSYKRVLRQSVVYIWYTATSRCNRVQQIVTTEEEVGKLTGGSGYS